MNQLERILIIHHLLKHHRTLLTKDLEEILEVSRATVHRDVEYMRDRLNAPIVYSRQTPQGFMYDPEIEFDFPGMWLSSSELYAIFYLTRIFDHLTPKFLKHLLNPINENIQFKIHNFLSKTGYTPDKIIEKISILSDRPSQVSPLILEQITKAVFANKKIQITYYNNQTSITKLHIPLHIFYYKCHWYILFIEQNTKNQYKVIDIGTIQKVVITKETFKPITKEEVQSHLNNAFGLSFNENPIKFATLEFSEQISNTVKNEIWHPTQKGKILKNGKYLLEVPYKKESDLISAILEYGNDVKIIEPAILKQKLLDKVQSIQNLYKENSKH